MAHNQSGDTLVEVLASIAVLGLVIVGAITIMTRGLSASQTALEHSQVRLLITGQSEMLERLRDSYSADPDSTAGQLWHTIVTSSNTNVPSYADDCAIAADKSGTAFYLTQNATDIVRTAYSTASLPSGVPSPGSGFWIEPSKSSGVAPPYMDFVIRACWQGSGGVNQRTVTAVRLYDPDISH
jgi:hypothetical protein